MKLKRGELGVDLLGINALDPFFRNSSSPRKTMFATQIGQAPVVDGNTPRRIFTGAEAEYAKYTFDVKFPCHATVLKVLHKYPLSAGGDAIRHNPVTAILYEDYYCPFKTIGVLMIPDYCSMHQEFGFPYKRVSQNWERMAAGAQFAKDEALVVSPAVRENGEYGYGVEAEAAFMSMPGTIEDGFILSESFLKKMTPTAYSTLVGNWGRKTFPLNLYGDDTHYKPFPDIGDRIREDGVVFALREIDDDMGIAEMTPRALREIDHGFDRPLYGKPGARVVDVTVFHDDRLNPSHTPLHMDTQARKYYDAHVHFYQSLMEEYNRLKRRRKQSLKITPEFNRLLVEAQVFMPTPMERRKLTRMYRLETLDEWRVEVTYEYKMPAGEGYKLSDTHGGKGVDCKTLPDKDMPIDENGNRADVVIYGGSTVKRMNFGRMYEQFINAASRDLTHRLRKACGLEPHLPPTAYQLTQLKGEQCIEWCWERLMAYYGIVAPLQLEMMKNDSDHHRHVASVLKDGIYLYIPPDNPVNNLAMAKALRDSEFCPHYGLVTYTDNAGHRVNTSGPVLIGSLYMILLEKTGEDWSSVASVKTQHFGVPAKLNNYDKQTSPGRQAPVRGLGESETRSFISTVGPEGTMELLDQSNNPETHREVTRSILQAKYPSNIEQVVDRKKVPFGGSRPVGFVNHLLACRGLKFVNGPDSAED